MLSVVIGRFQAPYLHEGHRELLDVALRCGERVLVLIGTTASEGTDKNPLCFKTRKFLFDRWNVEVKALSDFPSDYDWSNEIDRLIDETGFKDAMIFGGRDNSIEGYYHGRHPFKIISGIGSHSATQLREDVMPQNSDDFRAGMIYQSMKRYPIVYSTVDVILYDDSKKKDKILMGKKGNKFALIGGFVDPQDKNLQEAACRELEEETAILMHPDRLHYFTSTKVDDSRYRGTKDSIMTHVFYTSYKGLPDMSKIKDKEFSEFRFIGEEDINLVQECHRHIVLEFFNSF